MNGLSRARDSRRASDGETHPDDEHLLGIIEAVLRDGPEVGVRASPPASRCRPCTACSAPRGDAIREFALRVAGPIEPRSRWRSSTPLSGRHPAVQRGPLRRRGLGPAGQDAALHPADHQVVGLDGGPGHRAVSPTREIGRDRGQGPQEEPQKPGVPCRPVGVGEGGRRRRVGWLLGRVDLELALGLEDVLPPAVVIDVPLHGLGQAGLELDAGRPRARGRPRSWTGR